MVSLVLTVETGALLLAAFLYYIGGGSALTALFTALLAHELGHLSAMLCLGAEVRGVRLQPYGAVIEYSGGWTKWEEALAVAAGPAAGLLYAVFCFLFGTPYFRYSGLIAVLSSAYNLLPVYPMDGGRLARLLLECVIPPDTADGILRGIGIVCAAGVVTTGVFIRSLPAAAAGIWLLLLAIFSELR